MVLSPSPQYRGVRNSPLAFEGIDDEGPSHSPQHTVQREGGRDSWSDSQ